MRSALLFLLVAALCPLAVAQSATTKAHHTAPSTTTAQPAAPALSEADVQALRTDIARMKALVMQLQNNQANIDTVPSPLKHQFELELDMWNVVIGDMQRRLDAAEKR